VDIHRASAEDRPAIAKLLESEGAPPLPGPLPLSNVLVAATDGEPVGVIALEVLGRRGLVLAAAVAESHRGTGVGESLLHSIVSRAHELGLKDLYLLTDRPDSFFSKLGFRVVAEDAVPDDLRRSREFRERRSRSEGTVAMRLPLATRL
jgi:amino-acid N-acetyltransferase